MNATRQRLSISERLRAAGLLQPLRRNPYNTSWDLSKADFSIQRFETYKPTGVRLFVRGLRWLLALAALGIYLAWDWARGQSNPRSMGARLRMMFESVGGPGVKLGQQLAVRVDFLPFEVSQELGKLMDAVAPFDTTVAIKCLTELTGKPIEDTFARLDPKPIGSASIACVWRGVLHSGDVVAIKIRRPNIEKMFAADLTIISIFTTFLETVTIVRPEFFKYLRQDLNDMFMSELDLCREANHLTLWRRYVRRDRIKWLTAPKVYSELSNHNILTTEFIEGYSCTDILMAAESEDEEALAVLASQNIHPRKIGSRIMQLGMWGRLECPFFHADPHPGNILVRPNNQIVLLDFGACGGVSPEMVSHQIEMSRRLVNNDISGGTAVTLAMLAPLPNIDTNEIHRVLQQVMWNFQITVRSDDSLWWERTSAVLWVWTLEAVRRFKLPVNLDVLLFIRSTLLYDTLACRLNPDINVENAFKQWQKHAQRRGMRRMRRQIRPPEERMMRSSAEIQESVRKAIYFAGHLSRKLPQEFNAASSKSAFVASSLLKLGSGIAMLSTGGVLVASLYSWYATDEVSVDRIVELILTYPIIFVLGMGMAIVNIRNILHRLNELDPEET